jgi:hypothetical protein
VYAWVRRTRLAKPLQSETRCHGRLVGHGRIMSPVARPLRDAETGEGLQTERRPHIDNAEGRVGAARHLLPTPRTVASATPFRSFQVWRST